MPHLLQLDQQNFDQPVKVSMSSSFSNTEIRYTLDGSEPTLKSTIFRESFILKKSQSILAALFLNNKKIGKTYSAEAKIYSQIKDLKYILLMKYICSQIVPLMRCLRL